MPTCPACQRSMQDGLQECTSCGAIFAKWRGWTSGLSAQATSDQTNPPAASVDEPTTNDIATKIPAEAVEWTAIKPCPACQRDLAGVRLMDQRCAYCGEVLPDEFDTCIELPQPLPPSLPEPEEEGPFWKHVWQQDPLLLSWCCLVLLSIDLIGFCLSNRLARLLAPLTLMTMGAVAPTILLVACPYNILGFLLLSLCAAGFGAWLRTMWQRSPQDAAIRGAFVGMAVLVGNLLFFFAHLAGYW